MTKSKVQKPRAEGKGNGPTIERLRAILESPDVKEGVKDSITSAVGALYGATEADTLPDGPEETLLEAEEALFLYRHKEGRKSKAERDAYAKLAALVELHEPKDARLVRLLSEVLRDPTDAQRETILTSINDLSNHLDGVDDMHPDIFPTLARVLIREARKQTKQARGRTFRAQVLGGALRDLARVAGE